MRFAGMTFGWKEDGRRLLAVMLAALMMAVNIKTFVQAGDLYPGGVTGLTVLLQRLFQQFLHLDIPFSVINFPLNAIPIFIGFRFIGRKFTLYSLIVILVGGVLTDLIPAQAITSDPLLTSIFGGLLNGLAIGLCLMVDATSGGTDIISIYLSQKKGVETWNLILGFNTALLACAGFLFGWDKALYSIIFQYVATQTIRTLYREYQQQTLFIITDKAQEIADAIHETCHHGASIMQAEGSHEHRMYHVVYSVVSASDARRVILVVKKIDPRAFVNSLRTTELSGYFYMKPKD